MKAVKIILITTCILALAPVFSPCTARGDSATFTPPDVDSPSSSGNFTLTQVDSATLSVDTAHYEEQDYWSSWDSAVLGDYRICVISKYKQDFEYDADWNVQIEHDCELTINSSDEYVLERFVKTRNLDSWKTYITQICRAVCYE